jgi:hypothetical protein
MQILVHVFSWNVTIYKIETLGTHGIVAELE